MPRSPPSGGGLWARATWAEIIVYACSYAIILQSQARRFRQRLVCSRRMVDRSKVHKLLKHLLTVCWVLTASLAAIIARALWSSLLNLSVGNVALGCGAQTRAHGVSRQVLALAGHGQLPGNVPGERLQQTYKQSFLKLR
jgi:hypothetical protein